MKTLFMLVGIPGSGKTFYYETVLKNQYPDAVYISTDYYVEKFARKLKSTYSEVFNYVMHRAVRLMNRAVNRAILANKDIIWDQTSVTVSSRARKLRKLHDYTAIAIVFKTPNEETLFTRLKQRTGKIIPQRIILQMTDHWQDPTPEEGFSEIQFVEND